MTGRAFHAVPSPSASRCQSIISKMIFPGFWQMSSTHLSKQVHLFGYADKISVEPGEIIQFHVDADGTDTAAAQLVRLIHGDQDPDGPGFLDEEVDCVTNGVWQVEKQYTQLGSFLEVTDIEFNLVLDG